ncbi:MAG TPA: ABC transporter ATP-binding protein [Thermoplasmata archaeon]|nr:ABC transporter ATP-binding protein [Thermoplasmata archaeon]
MDPLLKVDRLKVYFKILKGTVHAVDDVSFGLEKGQTMGLVGESGCGKTTTAYAITRLLPGNGRVLGGSVVFDGQVIVRSDLPTEIEELLRYGNWQSEIDTVLRREESEFAAYQAGGGQVLEAEEQMEDEYAYFSEIKPLIDQKGTIPEEDLREEIEEITRRHVRGFGASRRRKRRDKAIERQIAAIRWSKVSMIFQSAMNAFNPVYRVGDQIEEALVTHYPDMTKEEARERVLGLFDLVGIDRSRVDGYPHEFSGGMRQRSMIAMALACNPQLLIADEPTTALDVIMQDRILAEIRDLQRELNIAMMIITHDISVVAEVGEKIGVMYAGKLSEHGPIREVFEKPANPYTIGLLSAFPSIKGPRRKLRSIPGSPPDLANPPTGCRFHPRCQFAQEVCKYVEPPMVEVAPGHLSQCHFAKEIYEGTLRGT